MRRRCAPKARSIAPRQPIDPAVAHAAKPGVVDEPRFGRQLRGRGRDEEAGDLPRRDARAQEELGGE